MAKKKRGTVAYQKDETKKHDIGFFLSVAIVLIILVLLLAT